MKVLKYLLLSCFCLLFSLSDGYSQTEVYYRKGNNKIYTKALVREYEQLPYQRFQLVYRDTTIYMYPEDVDEYTDGKTRVYESHQITQDDQIKKVFLLREYVTDSISLYSYMDPELEKHIFLKAGSDLILLSERGRGGNQYLRVLTSLFEKCRIEREVKKYTTYNVNAMRRFLKSLETCEVYYTPVPRFFAKLGIGSITPRRSFDILRDSPISLGPLEFQPGYQDKLALSLALRYFMPIAKTGVGVEGGVTMARYTMDYRATFDNVSLWMQYADNRVEVPLFLNFSFPRDRFQPVFKIGIVGGYASTQSQDIRRFIADPLTMVTQIDDFVLAKSNLTLGYAVGAELRHKISEHLGATIGIEYFDMRELGEDSFLDFARWDLSIGASYMF